MKEDSQIIDKSGLLNETLVLIVKILVILFWIIIFASIFIPNAVDFWLPHSQLWEDTNQFHR